MAFGESGGGKPDAAENTMSGDGFFGVNGAGGMKPALIAEPGAQQVAVRSDEGQG